MLRRSQKNDNRLIRHFRVRKTVIGHAERPRLSLAATAKHLEAQIIDDFDQKTMIGFSTKAKEFQKLSGLKRASNVKAAVAFGKLFAKKAKEKGVTQVVFDRGGRLYHGRIKAFADAAREGGLQF
ncbi:MAG: 50S ribosomal protein L18 [Candidatus Omnitrophica bacterium]|nr:50S ribosomal protein L18 [Candidatus Omnitrophota bacterium]